MLKNIFNNYSNISKMTCFGSCIQNRFRWKVLKVFVTFNYCWRHWTCLLQQFSQLMVEWCELWDSFEARSFYYTMPCHWYQFSVLGQFIPCGVAHSVSCSETIRSTSRQEYNACKYLDSLLRAISCPASDITEVSWRRLALSCWIPRRYRRCFRLLFYSSITELLKHCGDERCKKFQSARGTNTGLQQVTIRTGLCWVFSRRM